MYVRRINISGNARTRDEVIRREMRQLECAWYDGARIERSKVRIRRLGYFDDVNIETPPVQGTPDQADVDVTVVEKATGSLLAGVGYSSADGVVVNASVSQQNIFGSGNALIAAINTSSVNRTISLAFTEPYWTVDGISRTLEVYQRNIDTESLDVTSYTSKTLGGAIGFGIPITESDTINVGFRAERTDIEFPEGYCVTNDIIPIPPAYCLFIAETGTPFNSFILSGGWARDTRDDIIYPNARPAAELRRRGRAPLRRRPLLQGELPAAVLHAAALRVGFRADAPRRPRLRRRLLRQAAAVLQGVLRRRRRLGARLRDGVDRPARTSTATRSAASRRSSPTPSCSTRCLKGDKSVRVSVFFDAGQICGIPLITGANDNNVEAGYQDFRYSVGVGLAWNSPIGPLKFSYGYPLNANSLRQDPALPVPGRLGVLGPRRRPNAAGETRGPQHAPSFARRTRGVAVVALLALGGGVAGAAEYKVGFVNTERLFREAAPAKRAQQKLEKEFAARDAEIQKLSKQVRDLQAQLEKDGATMSEAERRNKERDLANQTRDLQRGQREFREDLNLRRNEELASVQERANKVIQQIAEAEKFDLILQDPVVFASQRIDITDKVIKALADK